MIEHAAGVQVAQGINWSAAVVQVAPSCPRQSNQRHLAFIGSSLR
jgi:hypothetical protein